MQRNACISISWSRIRLLTSQSANALDPCSPIYTCIYICLYTSIQVEFGIRPSMKWEKPFWRLWRCAWDVHNIFLFEANCSGPSSENESARRTKAMATISILLNQISSTISVRLPAVSEYECFHHHEQN